jgi:hypothetical protein
MSAASTPAPRTKSPNERSSVPRHTLFLPMFVLLLGLGALEFFQVMTMEDQLDAMTQDIDKMDGKVKLAHYERDKFYLLASAVLRMAPSDPNADQVATLFGLRQLQIDKPELMNANLPSDLPANSGASTNATPFGAMPPATNAAPSVPAAPVNK